MCATVFYRKRIRGRLYPKAARTGPYAFAQEVSRVDGRVVTRYLGIVQVRGEDGCSRNGGGVERPTSPANPKRFSRNYSDFRVSQTNAEASFLASLNWYGIAAERDCRIVDWSSVRCSNCGEEFAVERTDAPIIGPQDALPSVSCEKCGGEAIPRAYLPDLVVSREKRVVIEISGSKSSIHDRSKVDFYYRHGIRWIEVTNETVKSAEAVKAICQALAIICWFVPP